MNNDIDSPDYCDHNLGDERETPEEKEIRRLTQDLKAAHEMLAKATVDFEARVQEQYQARLEDAANRRPAAPVGQGTGEVPLLKPFATIRLYQNGNPADLADDEMRAEMWAYGLEEVYTEKQMREYAEAIRRHGNAGEDGERLDWLEATVQGKRKDTAFLRSMFICADLNGDIQLDIKLENVVIAPTLRAAIDQARQQGGGK